MSFKKITLLACVCSVLLFTLAATSSAETVTLQLTGVSGVTVGGVEMDPYYGSINGGPPITLVSDDLSNQEGVGASWEANVYTFSDLSQVQFQGKTAAQTLQDYNEAAYLTNEMLSNPSQDTAISFALWAIFDPSVKNKSGYKSSGAGSWLVAAESQTFTSDEFSNFIILTPVKSGDPEFLAINPVPEPASAVLLVSGLAACIVLSRKRRNS